MPTRKENFYSYYKANPDKLKGRTIDEAYAAMQREAGRSKISAKAGPEMNAVARRLKEKRVSPLAKGAAAITSLPGKAFKALPNPGFGSNQKNNTGAHGKAGLPDVKVWKAGESSKGNAKKAAELAAIERRLAKNSTKGGARA